MTDLQKISIIFPNFNGGKEPMECLRSIQKLDYPKQKIEVIVIDNNSTDGSKEKILQQFPKVIMIQNKSNLGFATAINQGIRIANGSLIFITNDDVILEKNSLRIMSEFITKNQKAGVLGGKIYFKNKPKKISSTGFRLNTWTSHISQSPRPNEIHQPDWVQGCAILIPKMLLTKIKYLDEKYSHSFEDVDLCLRIRELGFQITYLPHAVFWHGESTSSNKNLSFKYYNWYKCKIRFAIKNLPLINITSILIVQTFFIIPYRTVFLRDHRLIPFIKGLGWNLQNISQTMKDRKKLEVVKGK